MKNKNFLTVFLILSLSPMTLAVTSVITRHQSGTDFSKGETENIIVDSAGTLSLARQSIVMDCGDILDDVWSVHTMIADDQGTFYLGTGPDAKVIRYADQQAEQIYPFQDSEPNNADSSMRNEHVFAIALDMADRLLIGVSGETGKLIRLDGEPQTVFEDERVQYIFAIALDDNNNVYLGTGPEGLIFRLDPLCRDSEVIYDAKDKSILTLTIRDGIVYAGSDERGLVYKIDPDQKRATVLYDSQQDEIPALWMDEQGDIYAAATSAQAAMLQLKAKTELSIKKAPGRPDSDSVSQPSPSAETLNTANNDESKEKKEEKSQPPKPTPPAAKVAGHIYKITPDGFVTDIFNEMAVFYSLVSADGKLWLGTGNKGQVFSVDMQTEEKSIVFEDKTSSQITAAVASDGALYLGLSNPAKFVKLQSRLEPTGTYESDPIDAGQPARWGKLQIEADIPEDCRIRFDCRSGNVKDPNDATFSDWSPQVEITQATEMNCPVARFCQYRLTLTSDSGQTSPIVRQVTTAHVIPNLAPRVTRIQVQRSRDTKKPYAMDIVFKTVDENKDKLEYTLEFRKSGRNVWIPLKEELDQLRYQWDGRTVEDGRYEVRVTANDRKSNTPETTLTGSRISDVFVIDNTAPKIADFELNIEPAGLRADFTVTDELSVLGQVRYTVDSNEKWITALPNDLVYDTLSETFTVQVDDLQPGDHVIAFSVADDLKNTRFQTYEVTIP